MQSKLLNKFVCTNLKVFPIYIVPYKNNKSGSWTRQKNYIILTWWNLQRSNCQMLDKASPCVISLQMMCYLPGEVQCPWKLQDYQAASPAKAYRVLPSGGIHVQSLESQQSETYQILMNNSSSIPHHLEVLHFERRQAVAFPTGPSGSGLCQC